ncbi:glycosyltransferase family 4 protein [Paenibacillus antarcticus]|uniref:Spore coat protein n=1 Tax=Paenibacillus antarcticus TaxID=253703 RepID=A0A168QAW1_9BACL|nr:glycosyltransferase family 4 protein [Paenibacillus antarcticus]OAB47577.1 spore coat protein [Paenibacillus antarcticus]
MHILIVAPEQIPVPGSGSVEICILAIAKQLATKHQVTIISRRTRSLAYESQIGHVRIIRVASGSTSTYISSVLKYMKGRTYDFIQVDNRPYYMSLIKQTFPHIPVSLFLHSLTFVPLKPQISRYLRKADLIIANSRSLQQKLTSRFPHVVKNIRIVELGVDVLRFRSCTSAEKRTSRKKYRLSNAFTILFVGRVIPQKGVPILIKASHLVRKRIPVQLVVVGRARPSYLKRLKRQARTLGVPMTYIGKIPHANIHNLYHLADCFVCPSQKHEAFGLVNIEAMASGVPVIASRNGGIQEIVNHGHNGYLVTQYRRPEGFADYLLELAQNKSLRENMGENGRADVLQQFTWNQTATKLATLYYNEQ